MTEQTERCPKCSASVPRDPKFPVWCECGWNLEPRPDEAEGRLARGVQGVYRALGNARGRALLDDALRDSAPRPRLTFMGALLIAASAFALLGLVLPPLGATYLLVYERDAPPRVVAALLLLALTFALRPRFGRVAPELRVSRRTHPTLHELVERVAAKLGVRPPDLIAISSEVNARVMNVGVRRRRALVLGLPLLAISSPDERVALLGHELAHLANGDLTRAGLVALAVNTLTTWQVLLTPPDFRTSTPGSGDAFGAIFMAAASLVPRAMLWGFAHLAFDQSQRAEYYADRLGAGVAGSKAFVRMLERLFHGESLELAQQRVVTRATERTVLEELANLVASKPPRELERLRRVAALRLSTLDSTHPPTAFRVRLLEERPIEEAQVRLTDAENEALDRELRADAERVNRELAEAFQARLYR
jgi:Zn-dependent protease with chaperone function